MNIQYAIYKWTEEQVQAATTPASPLYNLQIHPHFFLPLKPGNTMRIGRIESSDIALLADGETRDDNAILRLYFFSTAARKDADGQFTALQDADAVANEWAKLALNNPRLPDALGAERICGLGEVKKETFWRGPDTDIVPVAVLRLRVNPR